MPLRPTLLGMSVFGLLVAMAALGTQSCSSDSGRQDQNYGTDVAADYGGPEVRYGADSSTQSDKDADAGDDGQLRILTRVRRIPTDPPMLLLTWGQAPPPQASNFQTTQEPRGGRLCKLPKETP